jgi:hypothetical protein
MMKANHSLCLTAYALRSIAAGELVIVRTFKEGQK